MLFCNCCVEQYLISCQCGKILVTLGTKPGSRCVGFPLRGDGILESLGTLPCHPSSWVLPHTLHTQRQKAWLWIAVHRCLFHQH